MRLLVRANRIAVFLSNVSLERVCSLPARAAVEEVAATESVTPAKQNKVVRVIAVVLAIAVLINRLRNALLFVRGSAVTVNAVRVKLRKIALIAIRQDVKARQTVPMKCPAVVRTASKEHTVVWKHSVITINVSMILNRNNAAVAVEAAMLIIRVPSQNVQRRLPGKIRPVIVFRWNVLTISVSKKLNRQTAAAGELAVLSRVTVPGRLVIIITKRHANMQTDLGEMMR